MGLGYGFYGGKSGSTYHLVQHFDSIKAMVDAFQKGGAYNTVNYGEYVIIDTIINDNHYSSRENGIIYRRGLNYLEDFNPNGVLLNDDYSLSTEDKDEKGNKRYYTVTTDQDGNETEVFNADMFKSALRTFILNPGGGAEYIGQIVGPQGESPETEFIDWKSFLTEYTSGDNGGGQKGSVEVNPAAAAAFDENGNVKESEIVDVVKYGYVNICDKDGNIVAVHISIDIPSTVFKYHAESIEPYDSGYAVYDETTNNWTYEGLISEDDISKSHPYYWQYGLKVPKGIKGQDLEQFDIELTGKTLNDGDDIDNSDNNYQYYYVTRNYDKSAEGQTTKHFIDSWNRTIHKITNNGINSHYPQVQRNTEYSNGDRVSADGLANGLILVALNSGITAESLPMLSRKRENDTVNDGSMVWSVVANEDVEPNLLTIHYTHGDNDEVGIRVLDYIICNDTDGRIYVKYSDLDSLVYVGQNQSILKVDYIDTPYIDDNGESHTIDRLRITYNTYRYNEAGDIASSPNYSLDAEGKVVYPLTDAEGHNVKFIDEQFKFVDRIETDEATKDVICYYNDGTSNKIGHFKVIDNVALDENNDLIVHYNDGTSDNVAHYKVIKEIKIDEASQDLIVYYDDGTQATLGHYKIISNITVDETTKHLIITYNDGTKDDAGLFKTVDSITTDQNTKEVTVHYNDGTTDDLGSLKTISKIYLENEGDLSKNKRFKADYNTKDTDGNTESAYLQNNPINGIVSMQQYGDNLIVLYSDPDARKSLYKAGTDYAIDKTAYTIPGYTDTTGDDDGNGHLYWINLGSIYKSNHVFSNFASVTELESDYPYGLEKDKGGNLVENQKDHAGWIVTVNNDSGGVSFYGFDYRTNKWYKMQDLSAAAVKPGYTLLFAQSDGTAVAPVEGGDELNVNGYWFVISTRED